MHRSLKTLSALLLLGMVALQPTSAQAQVELIFNQASQFAAPGTPVEFDATLYNFTASTINWTSYNFTTDPGLTISNVSSSFTNDSLASGNTLALSFDATGDGTGSPPYSGSVALLNGAQQVASANFQLGTPPPPAMLVTLAGGAVMALRSRVRRRKHAA